MEWGGWKLAETFDFIIINDSLEHTKNPKAVLKELAKMLKIDGKCILSFQNGQHFLHIEKERSTGTFFVRDQMEEFLQAAKLTAGRWKHTQVADGNPVLMKLMERMQERHPSVSREELSAYQWITVAEKQRTDIQFHKKMAVCIPTYQHSGLVEDVLSHCAELYKRYALDVYYFDSSEDDKTRKVVEAYQKKGCDNLHYIWVDESRINMNKSEHILLKESVRSGYAYIWYVKDRTWCNEKTLRLIYRATEESADLIFFDASHIDNSMEELTYCYNANEFYHRCGDYATSIDVTIYSVKTFLTDVNLDEIHQRCGDSDAVRSFYHYLIIFERLAQMASPKICLLEGKNIVLNNIRDVKSGWHDRRIEVWGKNWIKVNEALPDCYSDKDDIIKRTASFPWLLGDLWALVELHEKGILTPEYFEEIKGFWERVSNIPLDALRQIAYGEYAER